MKTIGIIGAMDEEVAFIKEISEIISAKNILGLDFFVGKYGSNSVVIVKCGIGKVNAAACTQVLIDHFAVDCVINVGVAGGIFADLKIGDVVISTDAVQHDIDVSALGDPIGTIPRMDESYFKADEELIDLAEKAGETLEGHNVYKGRVASGDKFISTQEQKTFLWNNFKAYCAEMEGAAMAHVCYLNRIPFVIIRSISDNADGSAGISYNEFKDTAAKNSSIILEGLLTSLN